MTPIINILERDEALQLDNEEKTESENEYPCEIDIDIFSNSDQWELPSDVVERLTEIAGARANNSIENDISRLNLTPANIISKLPQNIDKNSVKVPRALGVANKGDSELQERLIIYHFVCSPYIFYLYMLLFLKRERGNEYFKNGEFNSAVKSYTKCIGLKVRNYIAFSNR